MDKNKLAQIFHFDLYGMREEKYKFLDDNSMASIPWKELKAKEPDFYFVKKDFVSNNEYTSFIKISDLFINYSAGIQSKRDELFIDESREQLESRIFKLINEPLDSDFINQFNIKDSSSYKIIQKISQIKFDNHNIVKLHYRPFDDKYIYYDPKLIGRAFYKVMKNLKHPENIGLVLSKQFNDSFKYVLVSDKICDMNLISNAGSFGAGFSFPLYLYTDNIQQTSNQIFPKRIPNLNREIINQIAGKLGLRFTNEKEDDILENASPVCYATSREVREEFMLAEPPQTFAPIDILDYIYAVLYSPTYREKYKEFLKIDFPRAPYPKNQFTFWQLVKLGAELRQIHLLECTVVEKFITTYPVDGNNVVGKVVYENGRVYINRRASSSPSVIEKLQYFENVPQIAWDFYIGGYQPAQKWLKDRKGHELTSDDISHYQKIIVALKETGRIMKEIDKIKME